MKSNRGFIRGILIIIFIIVLLAYFKVDLQNLFESEVVQKWSAFLWERLKYLWNDVLKPWFDSLS